MLQQGGEGLSRSQRWVALHFLLGVPLTPTDEARKDEICLVAGYVRGFLRHVCAILRVGVRVAEKAVWGQRGTANFCMSLFARFGRGAVSLNWCVSN